MTRVEFGCPVAASHRGNLTILEGCRCRNSRTSARRSTAPAPAPPLPTAVCGVAPQPVPTICCYRRAKCKIPTAAAHAQSARAAARRSELSSPAAQQLSSSAARKHVPFHARCVRLPLPPVALPEVELTHGRSARRCVSVECFSVSCVSAPGHRHASCGTLAATG